jgi:hypothetical protein
MQYAQPGMTLSADVYDSYGNVILPQGTRLTLDNVAILGRMGGGEVFFDDRRVDDIPVTPLMPASLEGDAARKLNALLKEIESLVQDGLKIDKIDVSSRKVFTAWFSSSSRW